MCALCPKNNEIWIFKTGGQPDVNKWERIAVLKEHFSLVSALEWHPKTNLLLSASTDRAVIIWNMDDKGNFMPKMGILRELKANFDASWNTRGDKFAVGSSSGFVYVGSF
jgi:WD40 repeat protein